MAKVDQLAALIQPFRDSFEYYAPRCLKIRTKSGSVYPFELNSAQRLIHAKLERQRVITGKVRAIVLKGRQQGASTYIEGRFYWKTSMSFGKRAFILTHEQSATDSLFEMTKRYHDNCPDVLKPKTEAASAKELMFGELDSGYMVATAGSKNTGRSKTAQFFHGSEVAFWPNAETHMAGIGQTVPDLPGTEIILESTANGVGNLFHGMVMDAVKGKGEYQLIFVPWFVQEEYRKPVPDGFVLTEDEREYAELYGCDDEQMFWRRTKIDGDFRGDVALFDQEYPATVALAFRRVSGDPLIDPKKVAKARGATITEPIGVRIMGVDVAEYGDDDTAFAYRQGRVVSKIERFSKKGTMEVAGLVAIRADEWKPEYINVDCTGVGSGVADRLIELGYPVHRIHFGERAIESQLYAIRRDEMWGEMRDWFADEPCKIPDNDALEADLTAPQYSYDSSRRMKLERKEDMKRRGVHSPDAGDALALTFAYKVAGTTAGKYERSATTWR
jgi:hypothetical protein